MDVGVDVDVDEEVVVIQIVYAVDLLLQLLNSEHCKLYVLYIILL
jgi:hypothetical protein